MVIKLVHPVYKFTMVAGRSKRKKSFFKKGNGFGVKPSSMPYVDVQDKPVVRLDENEFRNIVHTTPKKEMVTFGTGGERVPSTLLRASKVSDNFYSDYDENDSIPEGEDTTYMVVHRGNTLKLFNQAFQDHQNESAECSGALQWDQARCTQWGICWSMALKCSVCHYCSDPHKLYKEVETGRPGRRAATANIGAQLGLLRHEIGPTGFADILRSMNMPAPSVKGMQLTANTVSDMVEKANKEDMSERVRGIQKLNKKMGMSSDEIKAEHDVRYNNSLSSGVGKTPHQPATRAIGLMCENVTREKQIIHVGIHAKICSCRKGHHKHGCKANLERTAVIGNEGKYLDMAMEEISSDGGPTITAVTLDGDSNAIKVAKEKGATVYYCTKHLTKNNAKHIKNEKFSDSMFPSWTKADKKKFQDRFGLDLAQRCQAELQGVCNVYPGDLTAIMKNTEPVAEAVYKCYTGNHSLCHKHSFVCTVDKPWQRGFLQATGRHKQPTGTFITPTDSDLQKLYKLIHERFGPDQLTKTYLNTTTQKCEASNRGLSRSLPKHKEFTRTAPGRAHAAVHSINNLHGRSLTTLAKVAGAPISRKSKVSHQLKNQDKEQRSEKKRQKDPKTMGRRKKRRVKEFEDYDESKDPGYKGGGGFIESARQVARRDLTQRRQTSNFVQHVEHSYA